MEAEKINGDSPQNFVAQIPPGIQTNTGEEKHEIEGQVSNKMFY